MANRPPTSIDRVSCVGDMRTYFLMTESERLGLRLLDLEVQLSGLQRVPMRDRYKARVVADFDSLAREVAVLNLVRERLEAPSAKRSPGDESVTAAVGADFSWIEAEKRKISAEIDAGEIKLVRFLGRRVKAVPCTRRRRALPAG